MNDATEAPQIEALDFTDPAPTPLEAASHEVCFNVWLDWETAEFFHSRAQLSACEPQEIIRVALQQYAQGQTLAEIVRTTIREEFAKKEQHFIL